MAMLQSCHARCTTQREELEATRHELACLTRERDAAAAEEMAAQDAFVESTALLSGMSHTARVRK